MTLYAMTDQTRPYSHKFHMKRKVKTLPDSLCLSGAGVDFQISSYIVEPEKKKKEKSIEYQKHIVSIYGKTGGNECAINLGQKSQPKARWLNYGRT